VEAMDILMLTIETRFSRTRQDVHQPERPFFRSITSGGKRQEAAGCGQPWPPSAISVGPFCILSSCSLVCLGCGARLQALVVEGTRWSIDFDFLKTDWHSLKAE
jgi:hypothetical protein